MTMASQDFVFHPETKAYLEQLQKNKTFDIDTTAGDPVSVAQEWRKAVYFMDALMKSEHGEFKFDGSRKEVIVPSEEVPGGIPVYVYEPQTLASDAPIIVYFHGGGCFMGARDLVDETCKMLSSAAKCIVVNVEYRLAPEHKFPAMINDAEAAVKWVFANRTSIGGSNKSKVGLSGDSAGGMISASVSHVLPEVDFQILIYPYLRGDVYDLPSYREFKDRPTPTGGSLEWCLKTVIEKEEDRLNPRYAVLQNEKYDHLPPTLLIVAEYDSLRDDSYEYLKKLIAAGVECELHLVKGVIHGFFTAPGFYPELCRDSYDKAAQFVKKVNAQSA